MSSPISIPWLDQDSPFPSVEQALSYPAGLLAAGADLSLPRLRDAYCNGIFPWYGEGDPVLWWSLDPRMVLACEQFRPSHSLRKRLRAVARQETAPQPAIQVRVDTAFEQVLQACAAPRAGETGTWILPEMQQAYCDWHAAGDVHSIETWIDGQLAGGLYGVSLGAMFYGESMFSRVTDASKIALAYLVRFLSRHGVTHIDCQQDTPHLASLGAAPIPRDEFLIRVHAALQRPSPPWQRGWLSADGTIQPLASQV